MVIHKKPNKTRTPHHLRLLLLLLFLTAALAAGGYSASRPAVASHIVEATSTTTAAKLVHAHNGAVTSRLELIDGVGAVLTETAVSTLRRHPDIVRVTPNAIVKAAAFQPTTTTILTPTADYAEGVGANVVWNPPADLSDTGVTGEDVAVAIVDSGIDIKLPGLDKKANNEKRMGTFVDFVDITVNRSVDANGHGSHMAGIIGDSNGDMNDWNGIAPNVDLINVRVLDEQGFGTYERVIQGIQWVVNNKDTHNIKVMNLSLVAAPRSPYWADPLNRAVMEAWAAGIVAVAAAGNGGPLAMSIGVPGNIPYVITVGAFTDNYTPYDWTDDYIPPFSASGPTLDAFVKPDVVAPGAHMVATMQSDAYIARNHEAYKISGTYFSMAGTSQATAVVSGVSALILAHNPDLTPDEVKHRLQYTAVLWIDPTGEEENALYSIWQQGMGRVNAPDAVFADIEGAANHDLDVQQELSDTDPQHYEGHTYYDHESGEFRLLDDPGTWPGGFGAWSGGFGAWSGGFGAWSGGFGAWSGGFGAWSGGFGAWSGGFGAWSGGYTGWIESGTMTMTGATSTTSPDFTDLPWAGRYDDPDFISSFQAGDSPPTDVTLEFTDRWVEELNWRGLTLYLPFVNQ